MPYAGEGSYGCHGTERFLEFWPRFHFLATNHKTSMFSSQYFKLRIRYVNTVPYITDTAKKALIGFWIPQSTAFRKSSKNDKGNSAGPDPLATFIGSGMFGNVYKSEIMLFDNLGNETATPVAIKIRNKDRCCGGRNKDESGGVNICNAFLDDLAESSFLGICEHEYIARLLGVTLQDERHATIIMPLYKTSLGKVFKGSTFLHQFFTPIF